MSDFIRPPRTSAKWGAFPPDVLPMWVAEMDFPLAPPIAAALREAIDRSDTGYRWAGELPQAFAEFSERRLGWAPDPDRVMLLGDVLVGMSETVRRLSSGALVITPPVYPPFFHVATTIVGRELVEVPLVPGDGLDLEGLARAFARPEVTSFLLCNPHNPTGQIWTREQLVEIATLARRHDVLVISDEIWAPLTMPGHAMTPYLSLGEELTGPDIALVAASKAFNLAGLKAAQVVAGSAATMRRLTEAIPIEVTYSAGHLGVIASIAGYRAGDDWLDATRDVLAANAQLLRELLVDIPGIEFAVPDATYLAWLDCRGLGLGDDPASVFLERGRVALNPGRDFGREGAGFARLNLATEPGNIEAAVARMRQALA